MIRKLHRAIYLYFVKRIESKLFPKWKAEAKELRKKHLQHSQGAHYKLWWAATREMERRQEKEYQDKLARIEWLRPKDFCLVNDRTHKVFTPQTPTP